MYRFFIGALVCSQVQGIDTWTKNNKYGDFAQS